MARLVVTYNQPTDPSDAEIAALEKCLEGMPVIDRLPGTLLVEGRLSDIRKRIHTPAGLWSASPVQQLQSRPALRLTKQKG